MRRHYGLAAAAHNLTPSQTAYVERTPQRPTLRFSENGDEAVEIDYRTHWVSGALDDRKRERLVEKANRLPELVVMRPLNSDWTCHRCGGGGDGGLLIMEHPGPACLPRVGLGELLFLPAGDAALTRRAAEEFEIGRRRPLQPEPRPATNARAARGTRCPGAELVGGALRSWTGSPPRWRLPHEGRKSQIGIGRT